MTLWPQGLRSWLAHSQTAPESTVGPYGVEYHQWQPGALRWFELGGTEGRHIHSTKYTRAEAPHDLGVVLYDGEQAGGIRLPAGRNPRLTMTGWHSYSGTGRSAGMRPWLTRTRWSVS